MPFAKGRWIDENNRSHDWSGNVGSNDRNQIKSQIRSQTGAKKVVLTGVSVSDSSEYNERVRQHNRDENERRRQQSERLKSSSSIVPYQSSSSYSNSSSNSSVGGAGLLALIGLFGGAWILMNFLPWILMLGFGSAGTWLSEQVLGQSISEYSDSKNPTESQHQKAVVILIVALLCGGFGFVQGNSWQKSFKGNTSSLPTQVRNA